MHKIKAYMYMYFIKAVKQKTIPGEILWSMGDETIVDDTIVQGGIFIVPHPRWHGEFLSKELLWFSGFCKRGVLRTFSNPNLYRIILPTIIYVLHHTFVETICIAFVFFKQGFIYPYLFCVIYFSKMNISF